MPGAREAGQKKALDSLELDCRLGVTMGVLGLELRSSAEVISIFNP